MAVRWRSIGPAMLGGLAAAALWAGPAGASPLAHGAHRTGPLARRTQIAVDIALKPRDATALSAYATAVSTPGSPDYHHYLSLSAFRARFAPTRAQVATVRSGLRADGLNPTAISANGLLLSVRASAETLAGAFDTNLEVAHLADGRGGYANTSAPRLSGALADLVQGVVGLDALSVPHASVAQTSPGGGSVVPCSDAQQSASDIGAYTADQIASTYGLDSLYAQGDYGAGETVALLEFEPFESSDIQTYNSCYGIDGGSTSDVDTFDVSTPDGSGADGDDASGDGSGEAVLDIEQVLGLAPEATVDVYEAPMTEAGDLDALTDMIENPTVDVISTSWGTCEPELDPNLARSEETLFEEAATEGISVFAASGDEGSTGCDGSGADSSAAAVDDPASDPWVTAVGGTRLPVGSGPAGQSAWNDSATGYGAGGGGVSTLWTMPSYQSAAASVLGVISIGSSSSACGARAGSYCREVPDVSADADPMTGYDFYFSNGDGQAGVDDPADWDEIGGTSAATPFWAALTALADASSACGGSTIGFANPVLYSIADNTSSYAEAFADVTSGNIDYTPSGLLGGLFSATTGYDMATGLGTPGSAILAPDMCEDAAGQGQGSTGRTSSSVYPAPTTATSASPPSSGSTTVTAPTTTTGASPTPSGSDTHTGSGSDATTGSGANGASTTSPSCLRHTSSLHRGALALALSGPRHRAQVNVALTLTAGCAHVSLSVDPQITTATRHSSGGVDTLKIEALSSSGKLLRTLATLSDHNAASGDHALKLNLSGYAGQKLTLRFLASGSGPKTTFSLRSLSLSQS